MNRRTYLREMLKTALEETGYPLTGTSNEIPNDHLAYGIGRTKRMPLAQSGQRMKEGELTFWVIGMVSAGTDISEEMALDDKRNEMIEAIEIALEGFDCDPYRIRTDDYDLNVTAIDLDIDTVATLRDGTGGEVGINGTIAYTRIRKS